MNARHLLGAGLAAACATLPLAAGAQAYSCAAPTVLPPIHPELPDERNPRRLLPIGGYTLAVTWVPEYCYSHGRTPAAAFECGGAGARFGFSLHGLWPDGVGPEWPQYCTSTQLLPATTLRRNLCATPSAQLLQHEWAKHGTCMGTTPDAYFARSTGLYGKLKWPDMAAFGRGTTSAGAVAEAVAAANPGLSADMIRVTATRDGWLDELWFCLNKQMAYTRCRTGSGGVTANTTIRVARTRTSGSGETGGRYGGGGGGYQPSGGYGRRYRSSDY